MSGEDGIERIERNEISDRRVVEAVPGNDDRQRRRQKENQPRGPPSRDARHEQQGKHAVVTVAVLLEPVGVKGQVVGQLEESRHRGLRPRRRVGVAVLADELAARKTRDELGGGAIRRQEESGLGLAPGEPARERQQTTCGGGREPARGDAAAAREENQERRRREKGKDFRGHGSSEEEPGEPQPARLLAAGGGLGSGGGDEERGGPVHVCRVELQHRGGERGESQKRQRPRARRADAARQGQDRAEGTRSDGEVEEPGDALAAEE